MQNTVAKEIKTKISYSKYGRVFFVSSFPKFDVGYVAKLLAQFEKEGLITRIAQGVYIKARKTSLGVVYPSAFELVKEIAKRDTSERPPQENADVIGTEQ